MLRGTVQQIELLMMGDGARVVKELQMGQEPRDPAYPAPAALRRPVLHRKASLEPAEIS